MPKISLMEASRRFDAPHSMLSQKIENGELLIESSGSDLMIDADQLQRLSPTPTFDPPFFQEGIRPALQDEPPVEAQVKSPSKNETETEAPPPEPARLSVSAASRLFNAPRSSLYTKMDNGELPYRKVDAKRMLSPLDLARLYPGQRTKSRREASIDRRPTEGEPSASERSAAPGSGQELALQMKLAGVRRELEWAEDRHQSLVDERDFLRAQLERVTQLVAQEKRRVREESRARWFQGLWGASSQRRH